MQQDEILDIILPFVMPPGSKKEFMFLSPDPDDVSKVSASSRKLAVSVASKRAWAKKRSEAEQQKSLSMQNPALTGTRINLHGSYAKFFTQTLEQKYGQQHGEGARQIPRPLSPTSHLRAAEELLSSVHIHVPASLRRWHGVPIVVSAEEVMLLVVGIRNGLDGLQRQDNPARITALFEQAFRRAPAIIRLDMYHHSLPHLLEAVILLKLHNAQMISSMLLQHIASMAFVMYDRFNPFVVFARCLLQLLDIEGALESVCEALVDAIDAGVAKESLDAVDTKFHVFDTVLSLRQDNGVVPDAIAWYDRLLKDSQSSPLARHHAMDLSNRLVSILMRFEEWEKIETILSDAPAHLEEYITRGYQPGTGLNASPIRITLVVRRICRLGRALTAQGGEERFARAREYFQKAIAASSHYLGFDDPETLEAITYYSTALVAQGKIEEAKAVNVDLDMRLAPYFLKPDQENSFQYPNP